LQLKLVGSSTKFRDWWLRWCC